MWRAATTGFRAYRSTRRDAPSDFYVAVVHLTEGMYDSDDAWDAHEREVPVMLARYAEVIGQAGYAATIDLKRDPPGVIVGASS